jgi:hypothetical protein
MYWGKYITTGRFQEGLFCMTPARKRAARIGRPALPKNSGLISGIYFEGSATMPPPCADFSFFSALIFLVASALATQSSAILTCAA